MPAASSKMVKSACRVLQILEYFNDERPTASTSDFSREYGYPLSSASELLHCLVSLGYLDYEADCRRYRPTAKVAVLGNSVQPELFRHGHLIAMMDEVAERTGELVVMSRVFGLSVQYIHAIQATNPISLRIPYGHQTSLLHSGHGRLLISTYPKDRLDKLVRRVNSEEPNFDRHVKLDDLNKSLHILRQQGYALSLDAVVPGSGMLALLVRAPNAGSHLAIGIGGVSSIIEKNACELLDIMYDALNNHGLADMIEYYKPCASNKVRAH